MAYFRRTLATVGQAGLLDDEAINLYFALLQERNNRAILCNERSALTSRTLEFFMQTPGGAP